MAQITETNMEYPMFKGLQRPLGFMLVYALTGFLLALVFAAVSISAGIGMIMVKQRRGLYSKKTDKGIFIYAYSERL